MATYISRHTGAEIDNAVDRVDSLGVFSSSTNGLVPAPDSATGFLNSDGTWGQDSTKINTVPSATSNHVAQFTSDGQLADSGFTIEKSVPANALFTDTTYEAATTSAAGLMSAADKTKLDALDPADVPIVTVSTGTIAAGSTDPITVAFQGTFINAYATDTAGNSVIVDYQVSGQNVIFDTDIAPVTNLTCKVVAGSRSVEDANSEEF